MDSITHIALGACIGEAMAGKKLGKRAMLLGAIAQSIPDIDFVASLWTSPSENLLAHRGFTHSFLFGLTITPLLAMVAEKWHRPHNISLKKWMLFFGLQILIHLLIDGMNVYGVGWFEPFSHMRVAYNWIFVADPFFSIWTGVAAFMLLLLKKRNAQRRGWVRFGLIMSSVYILYCGFNKIKINSEIKHELARQHISYNNYFTTPSPLNNWLWYVVAKSDSGCYIGYRSVFDRDKKNGFYFVSFNDSLLQPVRGHEDLQKLIRFSKGYYAVQKWNDTLVFSDLRFGQVVGWQNIHARFVFNYYLQHPDDNRLVVQRGRFEGWNRETIMALVKRIKGN